VVADWIARNWQLIAVIVFIIIFIKVLTERRV